MFFLLPKQEFLCAKMYNREIYDYGADPLVQLASQKPKLSAKLVKFHAQKKEAAARKRTAGEITDLTDED